MTSELPTIYPEYFNTLSKPYRQEIKERKGSFAIFRSAIRAVIDQAHWSVIGRCSPTDPFPLPPESTTTKERVVDFFAHNTEASL